MAYTKAQLEGLKIINQIQNIGYCKNINLKNMTEEDKPKPIGGGGGGGAPKPIVKPIPTFPKE